MRKVGQAFAGFWRFLHRPLGVALLTIGIGSWLVPAWINHLQDHRAELNLKSSVIEQIEDSSAQTMRSAVVLVFRRREVAQKSPNSLEDSYLDLKSRWLLDVALIRGRIATYFPRLEQCWDVYADVVTSFISVPQPLSNPSGSLELTCSPSELTVQAAMFCRSSQVSLTSWGVL